MTLSIIVYSCHDNEKEHKQSLTEIEEIVDEIKSYCDYYDLAVLDGNQAFPGTKAFLQETIEFNQQDGACSFNKILDNLKIAQLIISLPNNRIRPIVRNGSDADKILERWKKHSSESIAPSIDGKVIIISHPSIERISDAANGAHGIAEFEGKYCFMIKSYKNILWHEVAHLFGADDHYCDDNVGKAKEVCDDPELCIMQWNPGGKPCHFCDQSKKEITVYLQQNTI